MTRRTSLFMSLLSLLSLGVRASGSPDYRAMELYAVGEAAQTRALTDASGDTIVLALPPLIKAGEITEARERSRKTFSLVGGSHVERWIDLTFQEAALRRLSAFTEAHRGDKLVFVLGDKVVSVLMIQAPITKNPLELHGELLR